MPFKRSNSVRELDCENLRELDYASGRSASNEACIRCALNLILVSCIAEEKRLAEREHADDAAELSDAAFQDRPKTPVAPSPVFLKFATDLSFPVEVQGQRKLLRGRADYTLWYSPRKSPGDQPCCRGGQEKALGWGSGPAVYRPHG
jgi:hypothetical protein